jgi:uncharacterized protein YqeY
VRALIRRDLGEAIRARDAVTAAALRSVLAALANAEAIDPVEAGQAIAGGHPTVAGSRLGAGAADAPRRELTAADMEAIVQGEIAERVEAAAVYRRRGHHDRAARLEEEAAVLRRYLPDVPS